MTGIKPQLHLHQTWDFFSLLLWLLLLRPFPDNNAGTAAAQGRSRCTQYTPLFLKQEDAYFGSCGGCSMPGRKVFMGGFQFLTSAPTQLLQYKSWTEMGTLKAFQKVRNQAQTGTCIPFRVSSWEQWPSLSIRPICSHSLKTARKVKKKQHKQVTASSFQRLTG